MSYYEDGPVDTYDELQHTEDHELPRPVGARLADFGGRIKEALSNLERGQLVDSGVGEEEDHDVVAEVSDMRHDHGLRPPPEPPPVMRHEEPPAFPVGRLGYNRPAVDARITELETELEQLRALPAQPSINEEIERLGEQTASILVVAHDQAHETKRLAQEQADRCIADAAANAVAMTENAKKKLHSIDEETDAIWRERDRLIEDARSVGAALISLAEAAAERFPAESKSPANQTRGATAAWPARSAPAAAVPASAPAHDEPTPDVEGEDGDFWAS